MPADIRTIVTCNLGEVISVSISDDYPQGVGLITTGGRIVVTRESASGAVGDDVTIKFKTRFGNSLSVKRTLVVLNRTTDFSNSTTTFDVACPLRIAKEIQDEVYYDAEKKALSDEPYEEGEAGITIDPIKAEDMAAICCERMGIGAPFFGLENEFSVARFDFSGGYFNVLSDLLYSEGLTFMAQGPSLTDAVSFGTSVLPAPAVIDTAPIGVGQVPGKLVIVEYSRRVLLENGEANVSQEELDWEKDETIGAPKEVAVPNPLWDNNPFFYPVPEEFIYTYTPRTVTLTKYDAWDRVTERTTTEYTILAEIAPGYLQHIAYWMLYKNENPITELLTKPAGIGGVSTGSQVYTIVTREIYRYKLNPSAISSGPPPEGYEEVLSQEVTVDEPFIKLIASTTTYSKAGFAGDGFVHFDYKSLNANRFIAKTQIIRSEYARGAEGQQIAKNITTTALAKAYTQRGQQTLAAAMEEIGFVEDDEERIVAILNEYAQLVGQGDEVRITSGREINLQIRPPASERLPLQTVGTSDEAIELLDGSAVAPKIKFSLPYAWDDTFVGGGLGTYSSVSHAEDAAKIAKRVGRWQSELLTGMRNGVNAQAPASVWSPGENAIVPVALLGGGAAGGGLAVGITWQADANGAIVSFDWLIQGGIGAINLQSAWFPLASTVTYMPPLPEIIDTSPTQLIGEIATVGTNAQTTLNTAFPTAVNGDGVFAQDTDEYWVKQSGTWTNVGTSPGEVVDISGGLLPMANELVPAVAQSRTQLVVTSFPYALTLLTSASLTSRTQLVAARVLKMEAPAVGITTAALAPAVSIGAAARPPAGGVTLAAVVPAVATGASVKPPATDVALAAVAPAVSTGASVAVPAGAIGIEAQVPTHVGPPPLVVDVPAADVTVAGVAPAVTTGASVAVPAKDIALAALAPSLGDPAFSSVSLLLNMDGTNASTTFTDSSSNALTVTANGNAQISTAQSKFGGASLLLDGTDDFLSINSNALFDLTGDFTIELFARLSSLAGARTLVGRWGSSNRCWLFGVDSSTAITMVTGTNGSIDQIITRAPATALVVNTWYHFAVTRSSSTVRIFVDGVQAGANSTASGNCSGTQTVRVGINGDGNVSDFNGYIDELRITKGVARYTANFTAPTAAFPNA